MFRMKEKKGRRREKNDDEHEPMTRSVSSEALRGVCAVFFIAIAGFLVLAEGGGGGALGAKLYEILSWLLGVGYILLPLSLTLLAVLIFRSFERKFGWVQFASMVVFLLAGLGLVALAFPSRGGLLGTWVSDPLVSAIDTSATVIFLVAFLIASLVVAFNIHLGELFIWLRELFAPSEEVVQDIENVPVTGLPA